MTTTSSRRALALAFLLLPASAGAQVVLTGRVLTPRGTGPGEMLPLTGALVFASLDGPGSEALSFRTWETEPVGWYRMTGTPGRYTAVFSGPAHFFRPVLLTNLFLRDGEKLDRMVGPRFERGFFGEREWDREPATHYFQLFTARGSSVTHVGFRLASDGVDGFGPGRQDLLVSIHRKGPGDPDRWERVGPAVPILEVDCGGGKNQPWAAGFASGEVSTTPGETHAVHIEARTPGGSFQAFWGPEDPAEPGLYRVGPCGARWEKRALWLAVGSDGDGLLIPYRKRIQKQFHQLTRMARSWSQTYVARGQGLASAILHAAVSGAQPELARQRAVVRVRRGGPRGPVVGTEKIAVGNGNYTGDASWGVFGAVFAPGEVSLTPGETYSIEFESAENHATLDGFINIKGQVSDGRPGLNAYRKHPLDPYPGGSAWWNGAEEVEYDLDLEVIEYQHDGANWSEQLDLEDLLRDGGFGSTGLEAWKRFAPVSDTVVERLEEKPAHEGAEKVRFLRLRGQGPKGAVDGALSQRVEGLSPAETYRLQGLVRSSWPLDQNHQCLVGIDPTGQAEDPEAPTILWTKLPPLHGIFVPCRSDPVRPREKALSVWLRGRSLKATGAPFKADFTGFSLRRVRTEPPDGNGSPESR